MHSRNLLEAFRFALSGLWYTLRTQRNMRIHILAAGTVLVFGLWLRLSSDQWAILVATMGLVLVSEMVNTVVESIVDLACPEYHSLAKTAKDAMAGTVVLAAMLAVIVGVLILGPPLWTRLVRWSVGP